MSTLSQLKTQLHRYKKVVIHSHNCGHTVYWTIAAIESHSLAFSMLAGSLGILTIALAIMEE